MNIVLPLAKLERAAEVLLVEDNYGDAFLTREAFERAKTPVNLSVAGDGEEALEMLRSHGLSWPDLILLDLNMPRMDGREVLEAIRADPEMHRIPVIVLTSSQAEIDVLKCYDLGANSYVVKPGDFRILLDIVESLDTFWLNFALLPQHTSTNRPTLIEPA